MKTAFIFLMAVSALGQMAGTAHTTSEANGAPSIFPPDAADRLSGPTKVIASGVQYNRVFGEESYKAGDWVIKKSGLVVAICVIMKGGETPVCQPVPELIDSSAGSPSLDLGIKPLEPNRCHDDGICVGSHANTEEIMNLGNVNGNTQFSSSDTVFLNNTGKSTPCDAKDSFATKACQDYLHKDDKPMSPPPLVLHLGENLMLRKIDAKAREMNQDKKMTGSQRSIYSKNIEQDKTDFQKEVGQVHPGYRYDFRERRLVPIAK